MSHTGYNLLHPDVTEVDIAVAKEGAFEYAILQQFGFAIDVNTELTANFYTLGLNFEANQMHDGTKDASGVPLFNSLKNVTMKYLADQATADDDIEMSEWSASSLSGNADDNGPAGQQIVKGIINPMLADGNWGVGALDSNNYGVIAPDTTGQSLGDSTESIDNKIASGLAATINNTPTAAHEEIVGHLLDQVIDASGSDAINSNLAAARELGLVGVSDTSGTEIQAFANQYFWMKVYLDVAFDGTAGSVTDYEQDISGGNGTLPMDVSQPLFDDDDDTVDGKANLVQKTAGEQRVNFSDLDSTFLSAFKGELVLQDNTRVVYGNGGSLVTPADDAQVKTVRVPILLRFNVGNTVP